MSVEHKGRRIGLRTKLNIMLITCILLVSIGLLTITYQVHCRKVDGFYFDQARRVVRVISEDIGYGYLSHLWEMIDTDEYREVRARAVAENDPEIIRDWMRKKPKNDYVYYYAGDSSTEEDGSDGIESDTRDEYDNLLFDYEVLAGQMAWTRGLFDVSNVCIQYVSDGVIYNLVEPTGDPLKTGEVVEPIAALPQYTDNISIPPTVYKDGDQYYCTACEPIVEYTLEDEAIVVGTARVDIDMNDVVRERRLFLLNSALFVVVLTLAAMAASLLLAWKMASKPLRLLVEDATGFAKGDGGFSKNDVITLPIWSNDEIGDLYREIRSMQERIVDNAERLTHITSERERVRTELRMASQIQTAMLPCRFPAFPDRREFDLYASMEPAKEVGGDFYDFFLVDDDHLAVVIADVSDKGVPAALFMMSAKIIINYRAQMGGTPGEILTSVNAQLCKDNDYKMFVTVWLGILELSTGRLVCTNAGHEYPIIKRPKGRFELFRDKHGAFVGILKKAVYRDYELQLEPGSSLFVYTDGLAEANNAKKEQFGLDRIVEALNADPDGSPRELLENVRDSVGRFVRDTQQFDDLTMLCLEYRGPG